MATNGKGCIGQILSWGTSPLYSETTLEQWGWGLVLILAISFLYSMIVRQVVD